MSFSLCAVAHLGRSAFLKLTIGKNAEETVRLHTPELTVAIVSGVLGLQDRIHGFQSQL